MNFLKWLLEQKARHDPVGDIAGDVSEDIRCGCMTAGMSYLEAREHITREHRAIDAAVDALKAAHNEWTGISS